jgi:hypothetical protein
VAALSQESPTLKLPITELLRRIRAERFEMLGFNLTTPHGRWRWAGRRHVRSRACAGELRLPSGRGCGLGHHDRVTQQ